MGKMIDLLFSMGILIGIILHYFVEKDMTIAEFYIALMLNYFGSRYLLMSNDL